jgi:hypothetical protein
MAAVRRCRSQDEVPTSGKNGRKWGTRGELRALHQLVELLLISVVVEFARAPKRDLIS